MCYVVIVIIHVTCIVVNSFMVHKYQRKKENQHDVSLKTIDGFSLPVF